MSSPYPFFRDLSDFSWNSSPDRLVFKPVIQASSSQTRVAWSFSASQLIRAFAGRDYTKWILCAIRVRSSITTTPPGGEDPTTIYSVFLRKNALSFIGIPGDFSMARENEWSTLNYPFPVQFLINTNPDIFVEKELSPLESRQMTPRPPPYLELLLHRVSDLSVSNYVFMMKDGFSGKAKLMKIYTPDSPYLIKDYFEGFIPGPFKVIPSWRLIEQGWRDIQTFRPGESIAEIEKRANEFWINLPDPILTNDE